MSEISVLDRRISVRKIDDNDYICITDIAKYKESSRTDDLIRNWLRNRNTLEFLGTWETLYNPNFNPVEFDGFRKEAGLNGFSLTPKQWIMKTNSVGLVSKSGRYGGTFAHKDIAFEFAAWISVKFKLYMIKEFQRLKEKENKRLNLEWNLKRNILKINYRLHTEAIKENLIPRELTKSQVKKKYANEADILNVALFGQTAQEFKVKNKYSIRDNANMAQLICLSNLESLNSILIKEGFSQVVRLKKLNAVAIDQMRKLIVDNGVKLLS